MMSAALILWRLAHVLLLLFGVILVAVLLRAAAWPIERFTPVPQRATVGLAGLLIAAALGGFFWLLGAQIQLQTAPLLENLPELVDEVENRLGLEGLGVWLEEQRLAILKNGGDLAASVASYSTWVVSIAASGVKLSTSAYLVVPKSP